LKMVQHELYDIEKGASWTWRYWKWSNMNFTTLKMVQHELHDIENGWSYLLPYWKWLVKIFKSWIFKTM